MACESDWISFYPGLFLTGTAELSGEAEGRSRFERSICSRLDAAPKKGQQRR